MSRGELQRALRDYVAHKAGSPAVPGSQPRPYTERPVAEALPIPNEVVQEANRVFAALDPAGRGTMDRSQFAQAMGASPPRGASPPPTRSVSPQGPRGKRRPAARSPSTAGSGSLEMSPAQAHHELERLFLEYGHVTTTGSGKGFDQLTQGDCEMDLRELTRFATAHGMVPAFLKPLVLKGVYDQAIQNRSGTLNPTTPPHCNPHC